MIDIKSINRRIQRIKDAGMRPVTITSAADIVERVVERKGTSKEGEFKSYKQVKLEIPSITREEYENIIKEFISSDYGKQTYYYESVNRTYQEGLARISGWSDNYQYTKEFLSTLSKKDLIKFLREFGDKMEDAKRLAKESSDYTYSSNQILRDLTEQWEYRIYGYSNLESDEELPY